jgi:Rhodopirellula transposase.
MDIDQGIAARFESLRDVMNEAVRRRWAAAEARAIGYGGVSTVARSTGMSITTIRQGVKELSEGVELLPGRVRRKGGGRKPVESKDDTVCGDLGELVEPHTRGHPESALRWTCKSTAKLAEELQARGHSVTAPVVARLLHGMKYSLQANRKTREGLDHPDRNAQFVHINSMVRSFQRRGQPVVSVDAKKKELVGDFKNGGQEWAPEGKPVEVRSKDFPDKKLGKALPYGIYDMLRNEGWVSVGITHDTAEFAVGSLSKWWQAMGCRAYPEAKELLVTADGGGSNSSRSRLWKLALQQFADRTGLAVTVCHFPPGTSKWNKIEHRMFCHITKNWRARPLESTEIVVNLIANTTTKKGLRISAALDPGAYETGISVSDAEMSSVQIEHELFHGEWNYAIRPNKPQKHDRS